MANKPKRYTHLVLDIDGTLVNKDGMISSADLSAIGMARNSGIVVTICTGRSIEASRKILKDLKLSGPHIFFDGTLVYDPQKDIEIYSCPLSKEIVNEIINYALREGLPLDLFSRTEYFALKEDWRTELRRSFFNMNGKVMDFYAIRQKEEIIKGGMLVKNSKEIEYAKKFERRFGDKLNLTWTMTPAFPTIQFINIVDKKASKGKALEILCQYTAVPIIQVCAIGDGPNDVSLLEAAGMGIAMQNSPIELKSVADYITDDVAESGVAEAIHRFLL